MKRQRELVVVIDLTESSSNKRPKLEDPKNPKTEWDKKQEDKEIKNRLDKERKKRDKEWTLKLLEIKDQEIFKRRVDLSMSNKSIISNYF